MRRVARLVSVPSPSVGGKASLMIYPINGRPCNCMTHSPTPPRKRLVAGYDVSGKAKPGRFPSRVSGAAGAWCGTRGAMAVLVKCSPARRAVQLNGVQVNGVRRRRVAGQLKPASTVMLAAQIRRGPRVTAAGMETSRCSASSRRRFASNPASIAGRITCRCNTDMFPDNVM